MEVNAVSVVLDVSIVVRAEREENGYRFVIDAVEGPLYVSGLDQVWPEDVEFSSDDSRTFTDAIRDHYPPQGLRGIGALLGQALGFVHDQQREMGF
jgi:hypothetical protein